MTLLQAGMAIRPATIPATSRSGLSACVDGRIPAAGPAGRELCSMVGKAFHRLG